MTLPPCRRLREQSKGVNVALFMVGRNCTVKKAAIAPLTLSPENTAAPLACVLRASRVFSAHHLDSPTLSQSTHRSTHTNERSVNAAKCHLYLAPIS
eukprot:4636240-Prymnesium_polylepis.1